MTRKPRSNLVFDRFEINIHVDTEGLGNILSQDRSEALWKEIANLDIPVKVQALVTEALSTNPRLEGMTVTVKEVW